MKNPFKREKKALTATSGVLEALNQGWSAFPMLGGGSTQRIIDTFNTAQGANYSWMYQKSPAVRTVIDVVVRNIGQLELRLYEEVSEAERHPRPDHPAALSLRYPDEETSGDKFVRSLFKDFLIHENAYAFISQSPNGQVRLQRIPAYQVQVQGSNLFRAENYRVWTQGAWGQGGNWSGSGHYVDIAPENMLHWRGEHPLDPRVGLSKLDTLRDVIAEDAALAQATVELANNGLQAPIWISRPLEAPEMTATTLKAHEEDVANRIRNRNRRPPVMIEGEQLQSFGVSPQDAQMMDVRKWAVIRVAGVYGVPPALVGIAEGRVDMESQSVFYQDTLPPYCTDFCRMLNQRLLVEVFNWRQGAFEFDLDTKTGWSQLPNLISATGRPVMTTDEGRAKLNLPPVPGGDELVTPGNVAVGGKPSVGVMPIQDPNKPAQDGSYRQGQPPGPRSSMSNPDARYGAGSGTPDARYQTSTDEIETKRHPKIPRPQSYQPKRVGDIERQAKNIARFEKALTKYFDGLKPELKATVLERKANSRKAVADWTRYTQRLSELLFGLIRDVIGAEGSRYASRFGGTFQLSKTLNYRKAMAQGSAASILGTIKQEINEMGLDPALGRTAQHAASAGASLGVRSTIWARQEAARQSPQPDHHFQETWVKDTERHAKFDGKSVPLGGNWDGIRPGSTPGCQCSSTVS